MNLIAWLILIVVLLAIFGGAIIAGAAWLLWFGIVGIIIGGLARLLVADSGGYGLPGTILAGLGGALLGGVLARLADVGGFIEFLISILVAAVLIALTRGAGSNRSTR